MMGDKKRALTAILGPQGENVGNKEVGADETHHAISEELIEALHNRDTHGVSSALKASHEHLSSREVVDGPYEDNEGDY